MRKFVTAASIILATTVLLTDVMFAKCDDPIDAATLPDCSYSAINGNCKLTIDRLNPITPPTIYVRHGCYVRVGVQKGSPLEDLTLTWKSTSAAAPADVFQGVFNSLLGNIGKIVIFSTPAVTQQTDSNCELRFSPKCFTDPSQISLGQDHVEQLFLNNDPLVAAKPALEAMRIALQPPEVGKGYVYPWSDFDTWKKQINDSLQLAISRSQINSLTEQVTRLSVEVTTFKQNAKQPEDIALAIQLEKRQSGIQAALDNLGSTTKKLQELKSAIATLKVGGDDLKYPKSIIVDPAPKDKNNDTQTWTVDYSNNLLSDVKRIIADPSKTQNAASLNSMADPAPKQNLVTLTIQFQSPSRIEVSTGVMVPLTPYHSYSIRSVASNGAVTDNVVHETKTYTVVPIALVHVRLTERIIRQQPLAFFVTGGVGYNPATSTVEFGAPGLTFSYRSIAVSGLLDIGRDTKLEGGFRVGQSLGLDNPASPLTSTFWSFKPAIALSVRIPLGGLSGSK